MGYRCVNDLFNYCSGEPKANCRLDPKTCGKHQTLKEQVENKVKGATTGNTPKQTKKTRSRVK